MGTQIRLLKEQSDQGLQSFDTVFYMDLMDAFMHGKIKLFSENYITIFIWL